MDIYEINKLMYETFALSKKEIIISKILMFSKNDKYSYPPFFRFRFRDASKNDSAYEKIEEAVKEFNGKEKWVLVYSQNSDNRILIPKIFENFINKESFLKKNNLLNFFSEKQYRKIIDNAIEDIPGLAKRIDSILEK